MPARAAGSQPAPPAIECARRPRRSCPAPSSHSSGPDADYLQLLHPLLETTFEWQMGSPGGAGPVTARRASHTLAHTRTRSTLIGGARLIAANKARAANQGPS